MKRSDSLASLILFAVVRLWVPIVRTERPDAGSYVASWTGYLTRVLIPTNKVIVFVVVVVMPVTIPAIGSVGFG